MDLAPPHLNFYTVRVLFKKSIIKCIIQTLKIYVCFFIPLLIGVVAQNWAEMPKNMMRLFAADSHPLSVILKILKLDR